MCKSILRLSIHLREYLVLLFATWTNLCWDLLNITNHFNICVDIGIPPVVWKLDVEQLLDGNIIHKPKLSCVNQNYISGCLSHMNLILYVFSISNQI